ncbi:MAG: enoyl-CoA hydratase-related protein, partial [Tistlia sp.]
MSGKLEVERRGAVAVLELARPEVLNALDGELAAALTAAVRELESDGETRVLVLCGRGERAFC